MSGKKTGRQPLDMASIRARLKTARGQEYWRSLEELAGTAEFEEFLHNEFPGFSKRWRESLGRRDVLRLMGASLALAGMSACARQPAERTVPYVRAPEDFVPGKPLFYATAMTMGGYATGLLVESHLGRPTKVEGNPQHPASLGATDVFAQASVLTLYDPDRSRYLTRNGRLSSLDSFLQTVGSERETQALKKGAGLRIMTETVTSPTLASQIQALLSEFPQARWHQYEPAGRDAERAGAQLAFGEYVDTVYSIAKADVVLALDADFLASGAGCLRHARDWASRRQIQPTPKGMNRLYAIECTPSNTGAVADHRLPLRASEVERFARAVARSVGVAVDSAGEPTGHSGWIAALANDLKMHRGTSLVIPGGYQSPRLHAIAHAMNHALANVGSTVCYTDPVEPYPADQVRSLFELVEDMKAGKVDLLVIIGGNPVFTAPADFDFGLHLSKVKQKVHLSLYQDETSRLCNWHVPEAHYLEAWSDARAFDGTATIMQPLIAPLYGGKSAHELLGALSGKPGVSGHDIVRDYWKGKNAGADFDRFWQTSLHDGMVSGSALSARPVILKSDWLRLGSGLKGPGPGKGEQASIADPQPPAPEPGVEIMFRPDPTLWDGRFANNGWLQELPKPLTKLTWDNAALISPATAERLKLRSRELVELRSGSGVVRAPIWVTPGHANDCVTVHLGYGRTLAGKVGTGIGFNAYLLRASDAPWFRIGIGLHPTGVEMTLACTQDHHSMEGRNLVRTGTIAEFENNPGFAQELGEEPSRDLSLYPPVEYPGYAWGMTIDLSSCIGCNSCVIACQAENNIPVVGKTEAARGRAMHWMRIDRYYRGENPDNPSACFQPVLCQHCENAPCEPVCPVGATNHSSEGLNQMVYNRCVGTRYCSNNCPYKVRRFNFYQYSDYETPSLKPLRNPDVTVRGRGVMEKCTYCVQRINAARIRAEKEDRPVRDGEVVTACQAACPTGAIVFGNTNERESRVFQLKALPLNYGLLSDLNTRPRTSYLAGIRNPNPAIERE